MHDMGIGDVIYVKQDPKVVDKGVITSQYRFDKKNRVRGPDGTPWQLSCDWDTPDDRVKPVPPGVARNRPVGGRTKCPDSRPATLFSLPSGGTVLSWAGRSRQPSRSDCGRIPAVESRSARENTTQEEIEKLLAVAPRYGLEIRLPNH